ncbi:LysM peptidoglycan-binding domain-containing protein [Macrococcus brunensis]|uniref:LysM peptidoglycan-binding domain-containing protein n=1 Tax=Macrococcus brunensis TaxID=198483 RepID=A0A4R6BD92_9STAP|nr:LysM peptidoglycan-binding domain-containing protein [Macrococcus brunensis]TDL96804.1 LysM peptidoglycan-binding domain-containing protein [Macrococcus brunensis]
MKKVLAASTAVAVAGSFVATANAAEYTVKSGDTLWAISQQYGTSVANLKAENGLTSNLILPKQVLKINEKAVKAENHDTIVYNIVAGDTLGKIAAQFNVTVADLKAWNNLSSDLIIAGKTLVVGGQQAAPVKTYQAPVQQAAPVKTYQAPAQQAAPVKTYQAPVQQAAPVKTYQAPAQQAPAYQAPKAATTQTSAASYATNSSVDAHLKLIMQRESGGNPRAVNPAGYYGLFQFSPTTWAAVGGTGNPANASVEEQWKRARILYTQYGAQHWSTAY